MNSAPSIDRGILSLAGLNILSDPWLSRVSGMDCFEVLLTQGPRGGASLEPASKGFFTAKIGVSDIATVRVMLSRGFNLIDTTLTLICETPPRSRSAGHHDTQVIVGKANRSDLGAVESIASSGFAFSRFHLDPDFPNGAADEIKRQWARNLVKGSRGDGCLVARRQGQVVGFLGFISDRHGNVAIDLVAVEENAQRQGVGSTLVRAVQTFAYYQGRATSVGTQLSNLKSMRLYESLGFRLCSAKYVMHGYSRAAEAA